MALLSLTACSRITIVDVKDPLDGAERMRLASIYEARGELDLALREYDNLLASDGKNDRAYYGKGNVLLRKKDHDGAEANYRKALALNPEAGAYYNNLALAYLEKGDLDRAEKAARTATVKKDGLAYAYFDTLGVVQTAKGDYEGAEQSLLEASRGAIEVKDAAIKEIYRHLIDVYAKSGQREKEQDVKKALHGLD